MYRYLISLIFLFQPIGSSLQSYANSPQSSQADVKLQPVSNHDGDSQNNRRFLRPLPPLLRESIRGFDQGIKQHQVRRIEPGPRRDDPEIISYEDEDNPAFFFTMPNEWGDHSFNVRFTPAEAPFMVVGLQVLLFDMDGDAGEPGMEVIVAESDWGGFPGDRLEVFEVPNDDLILNSPDELNWTEILLEDYEVDNILIEEEEDFHIVLNVVQEDDRDTLAIICDNGREQETDRSGFWMGDDERWVRMEDVNGIDIGLNLFIRAIVDYDVEDDGINIEPIPLDFGEVSVSTTAEMALTITNLSVDDLLISNVEVDGDCFEVEFEEEIILGHEEEFELPVTFTPDAVGEFQGTLTLFTNIPDQEELPVDLIGVGINDAPVIVTPIENIEVDEDSGITEIAQLDTVFSDPNGDVLIYEVDGPDELNLEITEDNILTVRPDDNYTAPDLEVTVTADDGQGEMRSSRYGTPGRDLITDLLFMITVRSINDPPEPFSLLMPEDGYQVSYDPDSLGTLDFTWQVAEQNEYEVDTVNYFIEFWVNNDENVFRVESFNNTTYLSLPVQLLADTIGIERWDPITFSWQVLAVDSEDSTLANEAPWTFTIPALGVDFDWRSDIPGDYYLAPNFPNPFNATTTIRFGLPSAGEVALTVFDIRGRMVTTLLSGNHSPGHHKVIWDAKSLPAGVYIITMKSGDFVKHRKVMLIR